MPFLRGADPGASFTNEIEAVVEEKRPMIDAAQFHAENSRFMWSLTDGKIALRGPLHYHNRFSLELASGAIGFRKSNLIGQRVYHWINYLQEGVRGEWWTSGKAISYSL